MLDTGAVIHFAARIEAFDEWWEHLRASFADPSIFVPAPVLAECTTGNPRNDVPINRLFARIERPDAPQQHILVPSPLTFARAGVLRTLATTARPAGSKHVISTTDATVVALAEERSAYAPVVVTTSDPSDIQLLVDLTQGRNIGVWLI